MNDNSNRESRECHTEHPSTRGVIMNCGAGNYVDLSNMPSAGAVLARVALDTALLKKPMVKIDFTCMLSYTLTMLDELDLVFTLVRRDEDGSTTELTSWPWKALMDQNLTTDEQEYINVVLEKNESVSLSYCDEPECGGYSIYQVRVDVNYFNITAAAVSTAFISGIAKSGCRL